MVVGHALAVQPGMQMCGCKDKPTHGLNAGNVASMIMALACFTQLQCIALQQHVSKLCKCPVWAYYKTLGTTTAVWMQFFHE